MEEQLEEKIRLLGEILTKKVEKDLPVYEKDEYDDFGCPYYQIVGYEKRGVFLYPKEIRKTARKGLKKLSKKLKKRYLDTKTREEFNKYFEIAKRESKENLRIKVNRGIAITIAFGIAGLIGLGVRGCIREERKKAIPNPHAYLNMYRYSIKEANKGIELYKNRPEYVRFHNIYNKGKWEKVNLMEENEDKIRRANEQFDAFKESTKKNLEKGYLNPKHWLWKGYEEVFGKEDWWPKSE